MGLSSVVYMYASNLFRTEVATTGAHVEMITVTWPLMNVNLIENQVFTASLSNVDTKSVRLFWQVEGGIMGGEMKDGGAAHFTSEVDTANWDWKKDNRYEVTFFVKDKNNTILATTSVFVYAGDASDSVVQNESAHMNETVSGNTQVGTVYQGVAANQQSAETNAVVPTFSVDWVPGDIKNNQNFIFKLNGYNEADINAYWNSEGGHKNLLYRTDSNTPFTAAINMYGWRWKGKGPYTISFVIEDKNTSTILGTETFELYWKGEPGNSDFSIKKTSINAPAVAILPAMKNVSEQPVSPAEQAVPKPATVPATPKPDLVPSINIPTQPVKNNSAISNLLSNTKINTFTKNKLFVPAKPAVTESLNKLTKVDDRKAITHITEQPSAVWLNGDAYESDAYIQDILAKANAKNQIPTFVLYNIPNRDCGSYSSGGSDTIENYKIWINKVAKNLRLAEAIVIVEPDALAQLNCVPEADRPRRIEMIKYAAETIEAASSHVLVYIDAGHPFWVNAEEMAERLKKVGITSVRGFALNVSNFVSTSDNITYGNYLSNLLGGKYYVIDTSRNGKGPSENREWCNPMGRALGETPVVLEGKLGYLDAMLWIKFPGESDGNCNCGPGVGFFWPQYAIELYKSR